MKKAACVALLALAAPLAMAADEVKIAVVNVSVLYNKSAFVQSANKTLQEHVKDMEDKLQSEKNKLQSLVSDYEKASDSSKKKALAKQITTAQANLNTLTQQYQQKIQEEQSAGLQKFTKLAQTAVEKVAKAKHINTVVNSSSVVYTDNSWVDITNETQAAMLQN